jgi:hypothetical protein
VSNYQTFESLTRWVKKLQQEADKNCFIVLVGNKCTVLLFFSPKQKKVPLFIYHTRDTRCSFNLGIVSRAPTCFRYSDDLVESDPSQRKVDFAEVKVFLHI